MKKLKKALLLSSLTIFSSLLFSDGWTQSALYIQGDKKTPIYVKVEGQMMPRQGMHYCIIPNLEAGIAKFEILFQANQYPPQTFNITIPEDGVRGLVLTPVDNNNFALFDLQTSGYILNNNKEDEAFLQIEPKTQSLFAIKKPIKSKKTEDLPPFQHQEIVEKNTVSSQTEYNRFIENLDLSENKTRDKKSNKKDNTTILNEEKLFKTKDDGVVKSNEEIKQNNTGDFIPNTDCSDGSMSMASFESFLGSFAMQPDDDQRLKYVKKHVKKHCFSTEQAGILANLINGQAARLEILQLIYPKVSDQHNYSKLDRLFTTDFLKKKFKEGL